MSDRPPPLRVLLLLHNLDIGGAQVSAYGLACELSRLACQPVVCTWRRGGLMEARLRAAGIPIELPAVEPRGWRRIHVLRRLRDVVVRRRIDVIHAYLSDAAFWGVWLQRVADRPCVISHCSTDLIDTVHPEQPLHRGARMRLLVACARRAAANVAVSASVRDRLVAAGGLAPDHVTVVPSGRPLPPASDVEAARARRRARAASGFQSGSGPLILSVGRLHEVKRLATVIAAAPRVLGQFPTATFIMLGDGPLGAALRAEVACRRLEGRFRFPGFVTDVAPWLQAADVYVSASRTEGLSAALLEAMAWGLPAVVSDIPGHRELARQGEMGLLVPLDAPERLADALIASLRDWRDTDARADRALALVRAEHDATSMARRHVELYERVLGRRSPSGLKHDASFAFLRGNGGWMAAQPEHALTGPHGLNRVGAVVIGRNEAPNLPRCLSSVRSQVSALVYVDSASEDGSADIARGMGVEVVALTPPFSIGRVRNAGFERLLSVAPGVEFVQFVDGDSEMSLGWCARASAVLMEHWDVAVVFGDVRERCAGSSLYDRIYAIEHRPPVCHTETSGGMAMMRAAAFRQAGGFNPTLSGFEDHELCFRLRRAGWRIQRLDAEMAIHEAGMTRFAQWWRRAVRTGRAYAQAAALYRRSPDRYGRRACRSIWIWGLALPLLALAAAWPTGGTSLILLTGYAALAGRVYRRLRRGGVGAADATLYAAHCTLAKFPQALGQIRFHLEAEPAVSAVTPDSPWPTVSVGAVRLHAITEGECVDFVLREVAAGHGGWIVTLSVDHLHWFRKLPAYAALCRRATLVVADGMPLVWASRVHGTPLPGRVAGADLVRSLSRAAADRGRSVFLLGGAPGTAEAAARMLQRHHPTLRVAGAICPPRGFDDRPHEIAAVTAAVTAARPDIVYVALGKPKQDLLIERLRDTLSATWFVGVGASFGFLSGELRRAPLWMQRAGLEWVHRLLQEPQRLGKRYLMHSLPSAVALLGGAAVRRMTRCLRPFQLS